MVNAPSTSIPVNVSTGAPGEALEVLFVRPCSSAPVAKPSNNPTRRARRNGTSCIDNISLSAPDHGAFGPISKICPAAASAGHPICAMRASWSATLKCLTTLPILKAAHVHHHGNRKRLACRRHSYNRPLMRTAGGDGRPSLVACCSHPRSLSEGSLHLAPVSFYFLFGGKRDANSPSASLSPPVCLFVPGKLAPRSPAVPPGINRP